MLFLVPATVIVFQTAKNIIAVKLTEANQQIKDTQSTTAKINIYWALLYHDVRNIHKLWPSKLLYLIKTVQESAIVTTEH